METTKERKVCGAKTEVYSRIVGYFRPVANWNQGKNRNLKIVNIQSKQVIKIFLFPRKQLAGEEEDTTREGDLDNDPV